MGCPTTSPDGSRAITGHSLRVGGAQGLARRGVELWSIQLLGRWGGDTVKRYLADAHLDIAARRATGPVPSGIDLEDLVGKVLRSELAVERAAGQLRGSADL